MNYRHHFHAGYFADVMKHALLVQLVRALQKKPKGVLCLDTHAGRGTYRQSGPNAGEGTGGRTWHTLSEARSLVDAIHRDAP